MMSTVLKRRRGAAAVELAVSVIFLVPLIMYMFFLQEMLIFKLNGQEAAVQSVWDFAVADYGSQVDAHEVGRQSRRTYCDHTAALDTYDPAKECGDAHHKAMTAHECWVGTNPGSFGGQVRCNITSNPLAGTVSSVSGFHQSGGVMLCRSRLGIMNYYLPNKFLGNFRGNQGFSLNTDGAGVAKKRHVSRWAGQSGTGSTTSLPGPGEDAHGDAKAAQAAGETSAGSNYWRLAWTENAMLVDPWAVVLAGNENDIADVDPKASRDTDNPLYARVQAAYPSAAALPAIAWAGQMISDGLLSPGALSTPFGDNLMHAKTAFKAKDQNQQFSSDHWAAQGGDPRMPNYRSLPATYFYGSTK